MGKLDKILLSRAILTKTVLGAAAAAALTTGIIFTPRTRSAASMPIRCILTTIRT